VPSSHDVAAKVARVSRSEAPETDQRFPRSHRLTARRQFVEVYNRGRKARRSSFTIFGLTNDVGCCRLGLTVTRRTGSAVARNRIKRVLRDVFRRHHAQLPAVDLVINGHRSILSCSARNLERDFLGAVGELARKVLS
jgi:ribonuclease P protein component